MINSIVLQDWIYITFCMDWTRLNPNNTVGKFTEKMYFILCVERIHDERFSVSFIPGYSDKVFWLFWSFYSDSLAVLLSFHFIVLHIKPHRSPHGSCLSSETSHDNRSRQQSTAVRVNKRINGRQWHQLNFLSITWILI